MTTEHSTDGVIHCPEEGRQAFTKERMLARVEECAVASKSQIDDTASILAQLRIERPGSGSIAVLQDAIDCAAWRIVHLDIIWHRIRAMKHDTDPEIAAELDRIILADRSAREASLLVIAEYDAREVLCAFRSFSSPGSTTAEAGKHLHRWRGLSAEEREERAAFVKLCDHRDNFDGSIRVFDCNKCGSSLVVRDARDFDTYARAMLLHAHAHDADAEVIRRWQVVVDGLKP